MVFLTESKMSITFQIAILNGSETCDIPLQFGLFIQMAQNFQDFGNPGKKYMRKKTLFPGFPKSWKF